MSEVAGVHRRVVYQATFSETEGQTRWFATFVRALVMTEQRSGGD